MAEISRAAAERQVDPARAGEAVRTLDAFRRWGYLQADLDWLGRLRPEPHAELEAAQRQSPEAAALARRFYCGTVAVEFMHIPDPERRRWIAERMEAPHEQVDRRLALSQLMRAEILEQVLQSRYIGSKRFSVEGIAALIPLLAAALSRAADRGAEMAVLAMSHRGRLNVMVQIVGRDPVDVLAGFEDVDPRSILGAGDVKYHLGATGGFTAASGETIRLHLVSNPSHLEAVNPVAMGRVRAKQTRLGDAEGRRVLTVLLHGDAAFAGQGIAAECLNLGVPGFSIGGVLHVVVNNLIGFTTEPAALHSSRFASDVAKRLPIPIVHVNAEDVDAVVRAARLVTDYRFHFGGDVVIDLIGYRRHGHSEVDDPSLTQPLLYAAIEQRPQLWTSYAERIEIPDEEAAAMAGEVRRGYEEAKRQAESLERIPLLRELPGYWSAFEGGAHRPDLEVDTGRPHELLAALAERLTSWPEGFHPHPKLVKLLEQRAEMARGERPVDYAMAEALAFASLVEAGTPVRISGQDTRRGTFNQRHAVWIDVVSGEEYCPLQHVTERQAFFAIYDSVLSEAAVLGYEYGFSRDYPEALVLWEAQFGDFVNGAQVILDQFVTAGEDKWGLLSGLVLLLPHGFEGQGPEHSSGRIERFLQLAAEDAIQVAQPSTAAQYFHLLRRQALRRWRKPLIVFTPKSALRAAAASSELAILSEPRFLTVLPESETRVGAAAKRIVLASGKVLHELRGERQKRGDAATAILGLEQVYPFPERELEEALERYPAAREIVWVQEEPANMGALSFVEPRLELLAHGRHVRTVKRSASASPATGSAKAHALEQKALLALAFGRE